MNRKNIFLRDLVKNNDNNDNNNNNNNSNNRHKARECWRWRNEQKENLVLIKMIKKFNVYKYS